MREKISVLLITFISFVTCYSTFGQNPTPIVFRNNADSLRDAGDVKGTIAAYKIIVAKEPNTRFNLYNYACALAVDKQLDSCFKYLYKAIELETSLNPLTDKDFYFARQDARWKEFQETLVNNIQIKSIVLIINWDYALQLFNLGVNDQAYYDDLKMASKKFGMNSSEVHEILDLKDKINKQNQQIIDSLINEKGYPRISNVGKDAANSAAMVMEHSTIQMQKKYIEEIKTLCEEEEAPWNCYATIYDQIKVSENKFQKYGTQFKINPTTKKVELFTLEDDTKVDEWREEIGLQPLTDYLEYLKWQYEPKTK